MTHRRFRVLGSAAFAVAAILVVTCAPATAGSCVEGGCHQDLMAPQFLHGPVAAEQAGAPGCVSCHVPAGPACTAKKAGKFRFKTKPARLCLLCHERGTGTQHTKAGGRCLSCHDPHGSQKSYKLMRAG